MTVIGTNIGSLRAANASNAADAMLQQSMQRLSTGKRINSAKDDAAGLAISSRMASSVRSMAAAMRNASDGISLAQTAEGAMGEVTNMLQRMKELATQASNGTLQQSDRDTLQSEMNQLISEIGNVSKTTNFNGVNLLDGKTGSVQLQTGIKEGNTIDMSMVNMSIEKLGLQTGSSDPIAATAGTGALDKNELQINGVWVGAADNGTASDTSDDNTVAAKVKAINAVKGDTGVTATASTVVELKFNAAVDENTTGTIKINGQAVDVTDAIGDWDGDSGTTDTFDFQKLADAVNGTSNVNVTAKVNDAGDGLILTSTGEADIKFETDATDKDTFSVTPNGGTEVNSDFDVTGGVVAKQNTVNLTADTGKTVIVGGSTAGMASIGMDSTTAKGTNLDITTQDSAGSVLTAVDKALDTISAGRGDLGAVQNRLQSTVNTLTTTSANLDEARSRIEDADFSTETTNLAKAQILSQASTAMLAQANQSKQNVLSLLR